MTFAVKVSTALHDGFAVGPELSYVTLRHICVVGRSCVAHCP